MIRRWRLVLLMVCMAFSPGHALAAKIVMVVATSVTVTATSVDVSLVVGNKGDADALVVTPFLRLGGVATALKTVPYIGFEGEQTWHHSFPRGDLVFPEEGTYPLIVRLRYHDAHMYPYSLVSVASVQIGESLPLKVPLAGEMVAEQITDEGNLELLIRNTGDSSLETRLTMVLPAALVVEGGNGKLNIPAGKDKQISYVVRNNGALPGSKHNVLAVIEFENGGQHDVVILEEGVAVAGYIANNKRTMIIFSAGFIGLLFFLVLFIEFRTRVSAA